MAGSLWTISVALFSLILFISWVVARHHANTKVPFFDRLISLFVPSAAWVVVASCTLSAAKVSPFPIYFYFVGIIYGGLLLRIPWRRNLAETLLLGILLLGSPLFVPSLGQSFSNTWLELLILLHATQVWRKTTSVSISRRETVAIGLVITWVIWLLVSTALSVSGEDSWLGTIQYLFVTLLALSVYRQFRNSDSPSRPVLILVGANLFFLPLALGQIGTSWAQFGFGDLVRHRLWINEINPTHVAQFLLLTGLLPCFLALRLGTQRSAWVWVGVAALNLFVLLLTGSRSALLGIALSVVLVLLLGRVFRPLYNRRGLALLLGAALLLLLFLPFSPLRYRIAPHLDSHRHLAESGRLHDWSLSWELIKKKPWVGHGLLTRRHLVGHVQGVNEAQTMPSAFSAHPHNLYLGIACELGLGGLLLLLLLIGLPLGSVLQREGARVSRSETILVMGMVSGLVALLVALTFGVLLYDTFLYLAFGVGLLAAWGLPSTSESSRFKIGRWWKVGFLFLILFAWSASFLFHLNHRLFLQRKTLSATHQLKQLETISKLLPFVSVTRFNMATLLAQQGNLTEAEVRLYQAISRSPFRHRYYLALASIQEAMGKNARSLRTMETGFYFKPGIPGEYFLSAVRYALTSSQKDKAQFYLKEALSRDPKLAHRFSLSRYWRDRSELLGSVVVETEKKLERKNLPSQERETTTLLLSRMYEASGRDEAEMDLLERYLEKHPKNDPARWRLFELYRTTPVGGRQERMVESLVGQPWIQSRAILLNEIAYHYLRRGEPKEALVWVDQAIEVWLDPYLPNLFGLWIAKEAFRHTDQTDRAREMKKKLALYLADLPRRVKRSRRDQPQNPRIRQFTSVMPLLNP